MEGASWQGGSYARSLLARRLPSQDPPILGPLPLVSQMGHDVSLLLQDSAKGEQILELLTHGGVLEQFL